MDTIKQKLSTSKLYTLRLISLMSTLLPLLLLNHLAEAKPLGYERLELNANYIQSDYFREKSTTHVYNNYANMLKIGLGTVPSKFKYVKDKRLIDIEVHITGDRPNEEMTLSGVWIENKDYYEQESWLQLGVDSFTLISNYPFKEDLIPLDIEQYRLNGESFYAVIWQRNVHKADWVVKTWADAEDINRQVDEGYRVVEFDQFHHNHIQPELNYEYFDAILVENTGENKLDSKWMVIWEAPGACETVATGNGGHFVHLEYKLCSGFLLNENDTIVDIEHVPFLEDIPNPYFPYTWAVVINHAIINCENNISFGLLDNSYFEDGPWGDDPNFAVGRVIDFEARPYSLDAWSNNSGKTTAIHKCRP